MLKEVLQIIADYCSILQYVAVCICFDFSFKKMIEDVFMFSANGSPPIPCDILDGYFGQNILGEDPTHSRIKNLDIPR